MTSLSCPLPTQVVSSHVSDNSLLTAQYITFFQRKPPRKGNLLWVSLKTTGAKRFAAKYFGQPIILTWPRVGMKHFLLKHLWREVFNSHVGFWSPWAAEAIMLKWKMALASPWSPEIASKLESLLMLWKHHDASVARGSLLVSSAQCVKWLLVPRVNMRWRKGRLCCSGGDAGERQIDVSGRWDCTRHL